MSGFPPVGKYNLGDVYTNRYGESRILGYDYQMVETPAQTGGAKRKSGKAKRASPAKRKLRGRKTWLPYDNDQFQKMAAVYMTVLRNRKGDGTLLSKTEEPSFQKAVISEEPPTSILKQFFTTRRSPQRFMAVEEPSKRRQLDPQQKAIIERRQKELTKEINDDLNKLAKETQDRLRRVQQLRLESNVSNAFKDLTKQTDELNRRLRSYRKNMTVEELEQFADETKRRLQEFERKKSDAELEELANWLDTRLAERSYTVTNPQQTVQIGDVQRPQQARIIRPQYGQLPATRGRQNIDLLSDDTARQNITPSLMSNNENEQLMRKPFRQLRAVHRELEQVDEKINRLEGRDATANTAFRKSLIRKARSPSGTLLQIEKDVTSNQQREQKVQNELRQLKAQKDRLEQEEAQIVQWQVNQVYQSPDNEAREIERLAKEAREARRAQTGRATKSKKNRKRLLERQAGELIKEKESYEDLMQETIFQENPLYQTKVMQNLQEVDNLLDQIDMEIEEIEETLPEDPANISEVRNWLEKQESLAGDFELYKKACRDQNMDMVKKIREIYDISRGKRGDCTKNRINNVKPKILNANIETIRQRKLTALREGMQKAQARNTDVTNIQLSSNVESALGSPERTPMNPLGWLGF